MADPSSRPPDSFNLDETRRAPTFVQIRAPVRRRAAYGVLLIAGIGTVLVAALGWAAFRLTVNELAPVPMQAAASVSEVLPPQSAPADPSSELASLTLEAVVSEPLWRRPSLMDWVSPFDASVSDRQVPSAAPPPAAREAAQDGSYEVSVRLEKGDTIGSALQKLGFEAKAVADAVSALAPHVRLKRLPIGLGMTLQIRPSEAEGDKPILQALTIQPDGRRHITVERADDGQYVVELPNRSTTR